MVHIGNDWDALLAPEFQSEYYQNLRRFLIQEYRTKQIYPDMYDIFNALKYTAYADVKCVILGQDPYHDDNQACGLAFAVFDDPGVHDVFHDPVEGRVGKIFAAAGMIAVFLQKVAETKRAISFGHIFLEDEPYNGGFLLVHGQIENLAIALVDATVFY